MPRVTVPTGRVTVPRQDAADNEADNDEADNGPADNDEADNDPADNRGMLSRPRAAKPCSVCLSLPDSRVVAAEDTVLIAFGRRRVPALEICGKHRGELAKVPEPYLAAAADADRRRAAAGLGVAPSRCGLRKILRESARGH